MNRTEAQKFVALKALVARTLLMHNQRRRRTHQSRLYTVTGTSTSVTAVLRGLSFFAGLSDTAFTITVTDTAGVTVTDQTTDIIDVFHDTLHV